MLTFKSWDKKLNARIDGILKMARVGREEPLPISDYLLLIDMNIFTILIYQTQTFSLK